jgi:ribose transport system permease protein
MAELRRFLRTRTYAFALVLSVALFVANVIVLPSFGSPSNWETNLALFAPFALVAMAGTPAILSGGGGLDISVGLNAGLVSNVLVLYLLPGRLGYPLLSVPIVLALGTAIGLLNGFSVAVLRYQPVIATLCALFVIQGVNLKIVGGAPAPAPTSWLEHLRSGFGPIPGGLVLLACPVVVWILLRLTPFHRILLSVGGSDATAYSSGVNVTAVRLIAYALGGLFAAVAGIAIAMLIQGSDANAGLEYVLIALAAIALGGTPIGGGRGGLGGAIVGAAAIFLIQSLLSSLNVNAYWNQVVYGLMLVTGAIIGALLTAPPKAEAAG